MSDKDIKAGVSAGPTGIPARSRLQPPTARALRPSGLAPPGGSVASSSQSRGNASTPGSSGARTTSISAPLPSSSKSPAAPIPSPKPPSRVTPSSRAVTTAPRSPKPPASSRKPAAPNPPPAQEPSPENGFSASVGLSIKDQIAARRAAMKKAGVTSSTSSSGGSVGSRKASSTFSSSLKGGSGLGDWAEPALSEGPSEGADDIFGRATVRETIMKAMHTGNLNLMSRQLTALPTSLFTLHLGITPAPLSGSSGETMPDDDAPTGIHRWEAMDLTVLKVGDNEIAELHEEIVLFGALKNVDLHKNKLSTLPASFGELVSLTHLDISHCSFTSLPSILSTLPALVSLNVSHNSLSSLNLAFPPADAQSESRLSQFRDAPLYSTPEIQKAGRPFEALQTLLLCGNKLTAAAIEPLENLPRSLVKLDIDKNPLVNSGAGGVISLLSALAMLPALKELQMRSAGLEDLTLADFPSPTSSTSSFPRLEALDVGDNDWLTEACVRRSLLASRPAESIQVGTHMDVLRAAASPSSPTSVKLVIGKHVVKEAWELELERRQPGRKAAVASAPSNGTHDEKPNAVAAKAGDDDEWGLPGFGKKEVRVRRNAAASGRALPSQAYGREPEEEISLPTTNTQASKDDSTLSTDAKESSAPTTPDVAAGGLKSPLDKYFDSRTRTLTLPSAIPQRGRGFGAGHAQDMAVPQQTFPHATIISHHAWVRDLRTLVLSNRRVDAGFLLPPPSSNISGTRHSGPFI
ncbi:L domain-like protein [Clavulina sp. PMI_390]|nr:L domain-like protein [Clavulina sp. PMI_390]